MILNRQQGIRVSIRMLEQFAAKASKVLRLRSEALTVCLVSNAEIARWNRAYRGKNGPTDVLSFPLNSRRPLPARPKAQNERRTSARKATVPFPAGDSERGAAYLGDIAIAPLVARRNALRFGRTFEDEMRILILHGMLHLMGYDHETDSGQMDRRERSLRRSLDLE
jgi:probable rRNA maturation factor